MPKELTKILLVEDDDADFLLARTMLDDAIRGGFFPTVNCDLTRAVSVDTGIEAMRNSHFDIVLLDLSLPGITGLHALKCLQKEAPQIPIILFTGCEDESLSKEALNRGVQDYLIKGKVDANLFAHSIRYAIERHRIILEVKEAREEALAATKAKSNFLAHMSHEIRSPLTAILGFTETLLDEGLSPADRDRAIGTVLRNGRHLLRMLSEILDLSKVEAGKLHIQRTHCSPFQILGDIESLMRAKAELKGISLEIDYEYPMPSLIESDPTRMKQILINLIENAIKFTNRGFVRISTKFLPGEQKLIFRVIDTGIGVTPEQQTRLFKAFCQADSSITREFGGTGLGLTISRQLAEKLGGTLELSSVPHRGSTFTLSLPVGSLSQATMLHDAPPAATISVRKDVIPALTGRILLAEDGADNQALIMYLIRKTGAEVVAVPNGQLAVQKALSEEFDLILMDMEMPIMDGLSALRILRQSGYDRPIVALTAHAMTHENESMTAAGCNEILPKPFDRRDFFDVLRRYLGHHRKGEVEPLVSAVLGEEPEYTDIVLDFIGNLPESVEALDKAARSSDFEKVKSVAHRLKSAAIFGFPLVTESAKQLETAARSGSLGDVMSELRNLTALRDRIVEGAKGLALQAAPRQ